MTGPELFECPGNGETACREHLIYFGVRADLRDGRGRRAHLFTAADRADLQAAGAPPPECEICREERRESDRRDDERERIYR